MTHTDI